MFLGHHAMHRRNPDFLEHPSGQKIFLIVAVISIILFFIYANRLLSNLENQWNLPPTTSSDGLVNPTSK